MKNKLTTLSLLLFFVLANIPDVSGQLQKGSFNLSMSFGAQNLSSQTGGFSNITTINEKIFSVFPAIDYHLNDRFFIGLETGYSRQENEMINTHLQYRYYQEVLTNTQSDLIHLSLRAGYGIPVTERFHFQIISGFNYAHISQDTEYLLVGGDLNMPGFPALGNLLNIGYVSGESTEKADYASFSIQPKITFFVSNSIGLNLGLGGFEYGFFDWDSDNDLWILSFSTNLWRLGVNFAF
jgi:hypothetical protein